MLDRSLKPRARAKALAELTGLDARELYDRLK
jgi:16S rRNA (cytidine1402-2'-O)-methyltransferase